MKNSFIFSDATFKTHMPDFCIIRKLLQIVVVLINSLRNEEPFTVVRLQQAFNFGCRIPCKVAHDYQRKISIA